MFPRGSKIGPASIGIGTILFSAFQGSITTSGGPLNPIEEAIFIKHTERIVHMCKEQIEYIPTRDEIRMSGVMQENGGSGHSITRECAKSLHPNCPYTGVPRQLKTV
jgi:hypothetical protein